MEDVGAVIGWIAANWQNVILGINGIFGGVIAISLLIPGEFPEKQLKAIVDILAKFSRK
jgi:hypothetical protein